MLVPITQKWREPSKVLSIIAGSELRLNAALLRLGRSLDKLNNHAALLSGIVHVNAAMTFSIGSDGNDLTHLFGTVGD